MEMISRADARDMSADVALRRASSGRTVNSARETPLAALRSHRRCW